MKNLVKKILAFAVSASMIIPIGGVFAVDIPSGAGIEGAPLLANHVTWIPQVQNEKDTIYPKTFARDYSGKNRNLDCITALYDTDGSLIEASFATGINTGLYGGNVTAPASGQTAKAFIWDSASNAPVKAVATYNVALSDIAVDIKIDGKSISEYTDNAVSFDRNTNTYNLTLADDAENNMFVRPEVKGTVSDNSAYSTAANYDDKTVVSFFAPKSNGITETAEYTINWTAPSGDYITKDQVEFNGAYNIIQIENWGDYTTATSYKEYTVNPGESKTVNVSISGLDTPNGFMMILVPADGDKSTDVIDLEGAEWQEDRGVIAGYDYSAKTTIYGKKSESAVKFSNAGNDNMLSFACQKVQNDTNGQETGSRQYTDQSYASDGKYYLGTTPANNECAVTGFTDELLGCNYIALCRYKSSDTSHEYFYGGGDVTVSFKLKRSAKVVLIGNGRGMAKDADTNESFAAGALSAAPRDYMMTADALADTNAFKYIAALGYIDESDIRENGIITWGAAYKLKALGYTKNPIAKSGTKAAELWNSPTDFIAACHKTDSSGGKIINNLKLSAEAAAAGLSMPNHAVLNNGQTIVDNGTSMAPLDKYPLDSLFELENAELIRSYYCYGSGNQTADNPLYKFSSTYPAGTPFYTFTVSKDCEVYILKVDSYGYTNGQPLFAPAENKTYIKDGMFIMTLDNANVLYNEIKFWGGDILIPTEVKYCKAGETVTVQNLGLRESSLNGEYMFAVAVKPIN